MSKNIIKPPSMGERGPVQLPLIYEAVGLPNNYLAADFIRAHVIPCVAATFSDGEIVIPHPAEEDPVVRKHFGTQSYHEGTFGRRLRDMFTGDDLAMRHQVDGLIRYSATVFAHDVVSGNVALPRHNNVAIHTQESLTLEERLKGVLFGDKPPGSPSKPVVEFDRRKVELDVPPAVVVDYGPGLQGRFHIERQIADMQSGRPAYAYLALGKGPFVNEFLMQYWAAKLGDDPQKLGRVIGSLYIGREDGIAAATTEFAAAQQQHTGSSEFADVVVASGVHTAGYDEVGAGISNAYRMLKPDGTLLIRAPKAIAFEEPGSVLAGDMVEMALQTGFDRNKAQFFDTIAGGEICPKIDILSVVLRK